MQLKTLIAACAAAVALPLAPAAAHAIGRLADVQIVDRVTGQTLPVYWHNGRHWVAGTPGNRYGIALHNRSQQRVLTVISVDGVNAISGETASWEQTGYVLTPWRSTQVTGWRKSDSRVAAFEFTALENSYAARTGRPDHVGVIGVAVFRERSRLELVPLAPPAPSPWAQSRSSAPGAEGNGPAAGDAARPAQESARSEADSSAPGPLAESPSAGASSSRDRQSAPADLGAAERRQPLSRLGTGHGRQEQSRITYTDFERARHAPDEVITIHYDSRENLVAMGVIPRSWPAPQPQPQPFPGAPHGYVPDPR